MVRIAEKEEGKAENINLYIAPAVYTQVKTPVQFEGSACVAESVPYPAPMSRARDKSAVLGPDRDLVVGVCCWWSGVPGMEGEGVTGGPGGQGESRLGPRVKDPPQSPTTSAEKKKESYPAPAARVRSKAGDYKPVDGAQSLKGLECEELRMSELRIEECAQNLLDLERKPSREEICDFVEKNLLGPTSVQEPQTVGWTFGAYSFGNKIGLTNHGYRLPKTTKLLNRYLKSVCPGEQWSSVRATKALETGPRRAKLAKDTKVVFAPLSRFAEGRVFIEDPGNAHSGERTSLHVEGCEKFGRFVGGDENPWTLKSTTRYIVEPARESRVVLVAYTPAMLEKLSMLERGCLEQRDFPLPREVACRPSMKVANVVENVGVPDSDETVGRLRTHIAEESKALQEEIEMGQVQSTALSLSELQLDLRLLTACCEHDRCQLELESGVAENFWKRRLQETEKDIAKLIGQWEEADNIPCVRASVVEVGGYDEGQDPDQENWGLRRVSDPGESDEHEKHPEFGLDTQEMIEKGAQASAGVLLQTRTVPQAEVWENLEAWRQPLTDEVVALKTSHQAVASIQPEDLRRLEQVADVSHIPAKGVFTQKPITNKLRARIVGCGNFLSDQGKGPEELEGVKGVSKIQDLYAGGMDGTTMRIQMRIAGAYR